MELILASQSPRRRELFELIGLEFTCIASDADEHVPLAEPGEFVEQLALRKAEHVLSTHPDCCVVGADTVVYLDGQIIGKPKDAEDAKRILRLLSGRTHEVYTGVAVLTRERTQLCRDVTAVTFEALSNAEIDAYVRSGEPLDKAGAYGIQGPGAVFVKRVEGCYFTVIGMPMPRLYKMLGQLGIRPRRF